MTTRREVDLTLLDGAAIGDSVHTYAVCASAVLSRLKDEVTGWNPESGSRRAIDITTADPAELLELMIDLNKYTRKITDRINEALRRELDR